MILRTENGSQGREVVWGLKSLPESGRKVAGKDHKRVGQRSAIEEEVEEEEDDLACLGG